MRISDLVELDLILKRDFDREELRAFGHLNKGDKLEQLKRFIDKFRGKSGEKVERSFNRGLNIFIFLSILFGVLTGMGLLRFSGGEFVNILYFLLFATIIPLIFGIITLISLFKKSEFSPLPSLVMQKILNYFNKEENHLDEKVFHFYNLKSASLLSFYFSLGILLSLIIIGITEDLPFGWSTTLDINGETLYNFIKLLGAPISLFIDIPTIDIIESSRYFSNEIRQQGIENINLHAIWWKYLIGVTIFYGIFFRFIVYLIAKLKFKSVIKERALELGKDLIKAFNEPLIETYKDDNFNNARVFDLSQTSKAKEKSDVNLIDAVLGWAVEPQKMALAIEKFNLGEVNQERMFSVGGLNFYDDIDLIKELSGKKIAFLVNSYEPPIGDTLDYMDMLADEVKELNIILLAKSIQENPRELDIQIWSNKIAELDRENIFIKV